MLRIGEFSRLSGLSIKALRHYHAIGLLEPAHVDDASGYRHYASSQVTAAQRIVALRKLGFSLSEIAEASAGDLRPFLDAKRLEIIGELDASRERLTRIEALLAHDAVPLHVVAQRTPERSGFSLRALVSTYAEADELFADSMARLPSSLRSAPRGALWHACDPEARRIDCEVVYFVDDMPPPGFRRLTLSATTSARLLYVGSEWKDAYFALDRGLAMNGWQMAGPKLERFVGHDVTELSVPVRSIKC